MSERCPLCGELGHCPEIIAALRERSRCRDLIVRAYLYGYDDSANGIPIDAVSAETIAARLLGEKVVTCERCGGEFETDWSDAEALAESQALFGKKPPEDLALVCDDCWKLLGFEGQSD